MVACSKLELETSHLGLLVNEDKTISLTVKAASQRK
jgi:hypothetical protein